MRILYILFAALMLTSCEGKKGKDKTYLPSSNGRLNNISVVSDNLLWEASVGETIREIFAQPLVGLPQEEPLFSMRQIPTQVFSGFATQSRLVLKIEKSDTTFTRILKDAYAKPQTVALVSGKTIQDIIKELKENQDKIIAAFNKEEVLEKQRSIKISLLDDKPIQNKLGFNINMPSVYKIGKSSDNFLWIRKKLSTYKTIDLMFYEVPMEQISKGDSTIVDIITLRNKITKEKLPSDDNMLMTVENSYAPALFKTIIDNKKVYEVRGIWHIENQYMAGPFVTYAIEDPVNKRYLIADGYVYAPSLEKRGYIFEIESILKSIRIN